MSRLSPARIIGVLGKAGSGKDSVADVLRDRYNFAKVALADPMKRFCGELFGFTDDQLFGPSAMRNAPDHRFGGLTPRHALQALGTEWGRACFADVWVDYALRVAGQLLDQAPHEEGTLLYSSTQGLFRAARCWEKPHGVVIPDVRFRNEVVAIRAAGGEIWRVRRGDGLAGAAGRHVSETEQDSIRDEDLDAVVANDGALEDLAANVIALRDGVQP